MIPHRRAATGGTSVKRIIRLASNPSILVGLLGLATALAIVVLLITDWSQVHLLTNNLPAEAVGVALSALITVFIVERALAAAEERRWKASVRATVNRLLAHCSHAITHLAMYYESRQGELRIETPARWAEVLSEAIRLTDTRSPLPSFAHEWVFDEVSTKNELIQTIASQWQIVVSRHPQLFTRVQATDDAVANWSYTRRFFASGVPQTGRELELDAEAVRPVAVAFLALRTELLGALPKDFE